MNAPAKAAENAPARPSDRYFLLALGGLMLAYVLLVGRAALLKLATLGMGFDLGMYEQVIWNTARGSLFATTAFNYTTIHLGSDPILLELWLSPLYALAPVTQTLLLAQTVALALGALPLYWLARRRLGSRWAALGVGAAYLFYLPLMYLNLDEFQPRAFALVFVLFAIYFLDRNRFAPYLAFLLLSLTTRSDVALFVVLLGVVAFLWRKPWRFSVVPVVIGSAWFFIALFVIVPHFKTTSGGFVYLSTYAWLGKTPGQMALTALTRPLFVLQNVLQPGKLEFLAGVFAPVLPFSLFRPDILLLAGPTLAINLLSPYSIQWTITHQYGAMLYPIAYASAVLGIAWWSRRRWLSAPARRAWFVHGAVALLLGLTLAENVVLGNPVLGLWQKSPSPREAAVQALIASVPPQAPLAVTNHVGPLAGRRAGFYFFPPHQFYTSNPMQVADYILIDAKLDASNSGLAPALKTLRADPNWTLIAQRDDYLLYKRTP